MGGKRLDLYNNWTLGELSDRFAGKFSSDAILRGAAKVQNFISSAVGYVQRRPGTYYVASAGDPSNASRLVPFVVDEETAFVLEFVSGGIYVFQDQAQVQVSGADYSVVAVTGTTFYDADELFDVKYAQGEKEMYLVHPEHAPKKLSYTSAASWSLDTFATSGTAFNTTGDMPSCVALYGGRLWFAGTENNPDTFWASKAPNYTSGGTQYTDFTIGSSDGDALTFSLGADGEGSNKIHWMVPAGAIMLMGTLGGEWVVNNNITPKNVSITRNTVYGSNDLQAILVRDAVLFMQSGGRRLREYSYLDQYQNYYATDVTEHADHITSGGITDWALQRDPEHILWAVRGDGNLLSFTYDRSKQCYAWAEHPTTGTVESVCVIPSTGEDEIWIQTARSVNANTVRHIEYFDTRNIESAYTGHYVDDGLYFDYEHDNITAITAASTQTIVDITNANPANVEVTGHGFTTGDTVRIDSVGGMAELNGREFTVTRVDDDNFTLDSEDSTSYSSYTSGGEVVETPNLTVTIETTAATLSWVTGDNIRFSDIVGATEANGRVFALADVTGTTLSIDTERVEDFTAYVSGGIAYSVTNTIPVTHLDAETVDILADGGAHAQKTVDATANTVTLDRYANRIHVGLPYDSYFKTVRNGNPLLQKRISEVRMLFHETIGARLGPDEDNLELVPFRTGEEAAGEPIPLFTGTKRKNFNSPGTGYEAYVMVAQEDPLPMTILAIGSITEAKE